MAPREELRRSTWMVALAVVAMAALAPSAVRADQLVLDDLIVDGSLCVGVDCQVDQPFYFTTVDLKENNLRIFFNDTSTSSAFPKNDWEIIANESADGGASFLGFADRGAGVVSVSGQGFCEGGTNHGLACGDGTGANCYGICVGGTLDGIPCPPDPSYCSEYGGTCVDAGVCVAYGAIIFRIEAGGPEDSLVIDSSGDVSIAGNLTVGGTIDGESAAILQLQLQVAALEAEIEAIRAFPPLRQFLSR